jgi:hypothetical protein
MASRIFAVVPAMVLVLGSVTALAQPAANPFVHAHQASLIDRDTPLHPLDGLDAKVTNAAYVSDGRDPSYLRVQKELLTEPGYSIGTGAAWVTGAW